MDKPLNKDVLGGALAALPTPLTREQLLQRILDQIAPVNFREEGGVSADVKISMRVYKVITIQKLLGIAGAQGYNLCKKNDMSYVFNGAYWMMLEAEHMKPFLGEVAVKMGVPPIMAHDVEFREQLFKQFLSAAYLNTTEPDPSTIVINLQNGTFEFTAEGYRLREFRAGDFITYQLPFAYDPEAKAPMFQVFLNRVLPDKKSQQQLMEYAGYTFTRDLKLEKVLMLYGSGANGKSAFFDILTGLLGPENCCSFSLNKLADANNGSTRAMLGNKLVNYATEVSGYIDSGIFKQMVSCEPIEARHLYGRPFMLSNYAKLMFNVNELPRNVEHTDGFFRRFLVIPFTETIPEEEQDIMLAKKIIASELPGIFNWALEGVTCIMAQKRFSDSEASKEAVREYQTDSDTVALFVKDMEYRPSADKAVSLKTLYNEYREFSKDDGYRPVSKKVFIKRLKHQKIHFIRKNSGWAVFLEKTPESAEPSADSAGSVDK